MRFDDERDLLDALRGNPGVAIAGVLRGSGQDGADEVLVWLLTTEAAQARALLPDGEAWTLHGWYGSPTVAELAGR